MTRLPPRSYWAATAAPAPDYPQLLGDMITDVCVIGGGYLGLSTALHLAEAGVDVVLLEAYEPGWGASGRNGGQIIPGLKAERSELVATLGQERGERLFEWSGQFSNETLDLIRRHKIECQASQPGWVQPVHSARFLAAYEKRAGEWQSAGVDARVIGREETARMLGTDWYVGAYLDPRGGRLHPLSYARGLARAATHEGVRILANSAVKTVSWTGKRWSSKTEDGQINSEKVLICTNAYSDSGRPLVPDLARSIVPVPSYMIATAPLSDNLRKSILPGGETAADMKKLINHFRLESDGRFLFGGRGDLKETDEPTSFRHVTGKLAEVFPQLANQSIEYRWNGRVAITTDGVPHLHRPAPGLWAALGCNGRGVGYCTSMGKLVSQLMTGMDPDESPIPVSAIRRIAFHSFHLTGARLAMWWKHFQDSREIGKNRAAREAPS